MSTPIEYYEKLAELIEFRDGVPYWLEKPARRVDINKQAGTLHSSGYRYIGTTIKGVYKSVRAHRILWFQVYGELPQTIDHINRNRDDNRINNLRKCTNGQNARNTKPRGKSKYMGVSWNKNSKKWVARCTINKENHHLGLFISEIEAAKAYDNFCIENNLTFANLNFKQENIKQES